MPLALKSAHHPLQEHVKLVTTHTFAIDLTPALVQVPVQAHQHHLVPVVARHAEDVTQEELVAVGIDELDATVVVNHSSSQPTIFPFSSPFVAVFTGRTLKHPTTKVFITTAKQQDYQ